MANEYDDLADSQFTLEFSADGTAWQEVPVLQEADYPESNPVLDDITPTDAHRKIEARVDFIEDGSIKGQFVFKSGGTADAALKAAYDDDTELHWRFKFEDAPEFNTQFLGKLVKFTVKPEKKKKIRVDFELSITSDLTPVTP